jgi:NADH:ubiquinone oxidoreductase subunit D
MRKPDIKIESTVFSQEYENQKHLEFGPELPKTPPLDNPTAYLGRIATAINEVILSTRSVEQLSRVLNEHVFESLRTRSAARAQARMRDKKQNIVQPTDVLRVSYQSPAENVIESVVLLSNRQRAKAITIRLEGQNGSWRATNIGFL